MDSQGFQVLTRRVDGVCVMGQFQKVSRETVIHPKDWNVLNSEQRPYILPIVDGMPAVRIRVRRPTYHLSHSASQLGVCHLGIGGCAVDEEMWGTRGRRIC
jgi:hypothetical protein